MQREHEQYMRRLEGVFTNLLDCYSEYKNFNSNPESELNFNKACNQAALLAPKAPTDHAKFFRHLFMDIRNKDVENNKSTRRIGFV